MQIYECYANAVNMRIKLFAISRLALNSHICIIYLHNIEMLEKIKQFVKTYQADIILVIGVILISLLSFAMGYIVAKNFDKSPLEFENPKSQILNPKQIPMTQIPNPKHFGTLENWNLDIVSSFGFRISNFYEGGYYWSRN